MSEKIRERIVEPDVDGRPVETVVVERKKKSGFGWGMILGVLIIAGGIIAFAYSQGSFQTAGREADQATAQVQEQSSAVAQNTGDAIDNVTNRDAAQNPTSETPAN
jgi:cytoskeletal protein RodZ